MGFLTTADVADRDPDPDLADMIAGFAIEVPDTVRDCALPDACGPIAFAFALYLRANNLPGGLIHVTGTLDGFPAGTGHYLATIGWLVIDVAYRLFDPTAPVPVLYERSSLVGPPARWRPWTGISGELEWNDPLYPDFVADDGYDTAPALRYVPARLADPQWVTPSTTAAQARRQPQETRCRINRFLRRQERDADPCDSRFDWRL